MRLTWAQPEDLLLHELVQASREGKDVSAVRKLWLESGGDLIAPVNGAAEVAAPAHLRTLARHLLDELDAMPRIPDPQQPDELDAIEALAPSMPPTPLLPTEGVDLADRIHGAWLGRSAGCLLGKPVEKVPRQGIEEILRSTGGWPLDGYFTAVGLDPDVAQRWPWNRRSAPTSLAENIIGMPEDDDLNFPILGLRTLQEHPDLTTDDVAQSWLANLPAGRVFTAERAAYRNLLEGRGAPDTATVRNPFREWIGALIRTDIYGWTHPGKPQVAARLAWTDARLSHTRNGIYGGMWAAGMAAAAVVNDDVDTVVEAGLATIPAQSALAAAVRHGVEVGRSGLSIDAGLDALHAEYGHLHWVHVINNAATIAYALTAGRGEFTTSVSIAVMAGWDTDSVGATVGGVVGAVAGKRSLPDRWIGPLDNRIATSLPGPAEVRIDELAQATLALAGRAQPQP